VISILVWLYWNHLLFSKQKIRWLFQS